MREISDTGNSRVISVRGAPAPSDKMSTQTLRVLYSESPRILRATSHTSLRARDYYTSSTLIGAKGRAGPTSPILEGPTEDVNARMWSTHGFLHGIEWIMLHGHLDYFQKPSLGSMIGLTQSRETMRLWTLTTVGSFYFYHVWGPAWIKIHWNSISLGVWSHVISHHTWESVSTLHDFGGVLGRPLDNFLWALTISWSRLLACVWSGRSTTFMVFGVTCTICKRA